MFFLYRTIEANFCRSSTLMAGKMNFDKNGFNCFSSSGNTPIQFVSSRAIPFGTTSDQGQSGNFILVDDRKNGLDSENREFNNGENGTDKNVGSSQLENLPVTSSINQRDKSSISTDVQFKASPSIQSYSKREMGTKNVDSSEGSVSLKPPDKRRKRIDLGTEQRIKNVDLFQSGNSAVSDFPSKLDESFPSTPFRDKGKVKLTHAVKTSNSQSYSKHGMCDKELDSSQGSFNVRPFDICLSRSRRNGVGLVSLHKEFKENNTEEEQIEQGIRQQVLRPGMVLLKNYLSLIEQSEIVKTCRKLGKGPGGFYQPGYKDGAKLRLQMMCLGLDWDPQTRKYSKQRLVDGCLPPCIPQAFSQLVQRAISDAHALIKQEFRVSNVEDILPSMSPNICIVNFYTTSGRLGLHQDRDESRDSLWKGLPVVSFSVGDSAEFRYGNVRDIDKSEKVVLESGDVLIFGGESRHIFHGVTSILPNSAPGTLLEQAQLRPGRLNLTFRQF